MFSDFYGKPQEEVSTVHQNFFGHSFQKERAIKLVAIAGQNVLGFASFSYWPYKKNGVTYNSYQVGNAIIHPDYRGQGIFQKILKYVDDNHRKLNVDFLFAFPHISASYPSFMKFGYKNPFDLVWRIRLINPFAFLFNREKILQQFSASPYIVPEGDSPFYKLARTAHFDDWFFSSRSENNYAYYNYDDGTNKITFYLKSNQRGKWINELIIGDIRTNSTDLVAYRKAFSTFLSVVKKTKSVTFISIAYNEHIKSYKNAILEKRFRKIKPVIHFVHRNYLQGIDLSKVDEWELYRGDIDTW
jgi:hypothetical protein